MSAHTGGPSDEPFHLLLFYAFLSGFAGVLLDENIPRDSAGHGPIEKYRRESLASSAAFELSAPGHSELAIASALESYLGERTWLLSDPSSRNWSVSVIRDPVVTENLRSVERTLAAIPAAAWLGADAERSCQAFVDWDNSASPPLLTTRDPLREIQAEFAAEARAAAERVPLQDLAGTGREWWSCPSGVGLPYTTRKLGSFSAVELIGRDDSFGETRATVWDVSVDAGARIAEIHDLADWSRLVEAYPHDATESRRAEWSPKHGWDGPWLLPDWVQMARDWDGVHLSAGAYLRSRGRAARVHGGRTVLEGWDPDATYWLSDALTLTESAPEIWTCDLAGPAGWHQAS